MVWRMGVAERAIERRKAVTDRHYPSCKMFFFSVGYEAAAVAANTT